MEYAQAVPNYANQLYADTPVAPGDINRLLNELSEVVAHVEQMRAMAGKLANELFGAPPPAVVGEPGNPVGSGAIDALHSRVQALRAELAALYTVMERFQRLA